MPKEPKPVTFAQMEEAVTLSGKIEPGATLYVKRAGGTPTIAIQEILKAFREKYPDTKFIFGDPPKKTDA